MTAAEILRSYLSAAKKHRLPPGSWIKLLLVASHGDKGCAVEALNPTKNKTSGYLFVNRLERRGLLITSRTRTRTEGRPKIWVHLTPEGWEALNLQPQLKAPSHD